MPNGTRELPRVRRNTLSDGGNGQRNPEKPGGVILNPVSKVVGVGVLNVSLVNSGCLNSND